MRRRALLLLAVLAALALTLAGCGGGSSSSASATGTQSSPMAAGSGQTTLRIEADSTGTLAFNKTTLEAPSGKVTIDMTNPSSVPHDIAIQGNGVDVTGKTVTNGGTSTVTANLSPGTYTFLCTVDSHADAGMKGTLTVK